MVTATAFAGMQQVPGLWGVALVALALIASIVPMIWVSHHRRDVLLARVESDLCKVRSEHQARMCELANGHAARLFELETERQQILIEAEIRRDALLADRRRVDIELPSKRRPKQSRIAAAETQAAN